jgi:hypothetical protein
MQLSASSAALDLASPQTPGHEANGWSAFTQHRPARQSLPATTVQHLAGQNGTAANGSNSESPISVRPSYRHSLDAKFFGESQQEQQMTSPPKHVQATPPKLQSSYSANDVPTMKNASNGIGIISATTNSHAQQHFHNHNASLGRIPQNAINNRQSRDLSGQETTAALREVPSTGYQTTQSVLQASAPAFGPNLAQAVSQPQSPSAISSPTMPAYPMPTYYNNYSMQMLAMGMGNMQLAPPMYPAQNPYANYGSMYPQNGIRNGDSQSRVVAQRRQNDGDGKPLSKLWYKIH